MGNKRTTKAPAASLAARATQKKGKAPKQRTSGGDKKPLTPIEAALKRLDEAGSVDMTDSDDFGAIAIIGCSGPPLAEREQRIEAFKHTLKEMSKRAKEGDCYITFEVQGGQNANGRGEPSKADARHVQDRFVQFFFFRSRPKGFYMDLPNSTLAETESATILRERPDFYLASARRVTKDQEDYVARFNPVHRKYAYGDEGIAAEDMAFILFDVWRLPLGVPFDVKAGRP
jgi:hypothetical protein